MRTTGIETNRKQATKENFTSRSMFAVCYSKSKYSPAKFREHTDCNCMSQWISDMGRIYVDSGVIMIIASIRILSCFLNAYEIIVDLREK